MNSKWYLGCSTEEDKKERAALILACRESLVVLRKVLEADIASVELTMSDLKAYSNAAWPYLQADKLGSLRAYNAILAILPEDDKSR